MVAGETALVRKPNALVQFGGQGWWADGGQDRPKKGKIVENRLFKRLKSQCGQN